MSSNAPVGVVVVKNIDGEKLIVVNDQSPAHPFTISHRPYIFNGRHWYCLLPVLMLVEAKVKNDDMAAELIYNHSDNPKYLDQNCIITSWTNEGIENGYNWKIVYNTVNDWMICQINSACELRKIFDIFQSEAAKSVVFLGHNSIYFGAKTITEVTGSNVLPGENQIGNELAMGCFTREEMVYIVPGDSESDDETTGEEEGNMDIESDDNGSIDFNDINFEVPDIMRNPDRWSAGATARQLIKIVFGGNAKNKPEDIHEYFTNFIKSMAIDDKDLKLSASGAMFQQIGTELDEEYVNCVTEQYRVHLQSVDFAISTDDSIELINDWAKKATNGKIDKIVNRSSCPANTKIMLLSAVYFKGKWKYEFESEYTRKNQFNRDDGVSVEVEMMVKNSDFQYQKTCDAELIRLPYRGQPDLSMIIILPDRTHLLGSWLQKHTAESLINIVNSTTHLENLTVSLPKFSVENQTDFKSALEDLGLTDIFSMSANFDKMGNNDLTISGIKQKAIIEVNEEGTVAAAVTYGGYIDECFSTPKCFTADHPFIFMVTQGETRSLLFIGKYTGDTGDK